MLADLVAAVILLALVVYTLTGGADFGGGVWDLLAGGPRKKQQRGLVARALAPIWEANHVWLILIIVVLFVALPKAFSAITTALHLPLLAMLFGIVLRGSAFIFRAYDPVGGAGSRRWRLVFAISSAITPIFLGICLGAVSTGALRVDPATGRPLVDFVESWLRPYPVAVGVFTLALFSYLAAVYLAVEAGDDDVADDFRRRGLVSAVVVGVLALVTFAIARPEAPLIGTALATSWWAWPLHILTGAAALSAIYFLYRRRFALARAAAITQVSLIVGGMGLSHYPFIVYPDLTFEATLAHEPVVIAMLVILGIGLVILIPSFILLYRVFKSEPNG